MNEETTIIKLPKEAPKIEKLRRKLDEYKARLLTEQSKNPYTPQENFASWYAVYLMTNLLDKGFIDTWKLSQEIMYQHCGRMFRIDYFENYCEVIEDYISTGGDKIDGGTGLR